MKLKIKSSKEFKQITKQFLENYKEGDVYNISMTKQISKSKLPFNEVQIEYLDKRFINLENKIMFEMDRRFQKVDEKFDQVIKLIKNKK